MAAPERVLVGGSLRAPGMWALWILGAAGVVIAGLLSGKAPAAVQLGVLGVAAALLAGGAALLLRCFARRTWLEVTPEGFRVQGRGGLSEHRDDQVQSLSVEHRLHHREGQVSAITYVAQVWLDEASAPLRLETRIGLGPLGSPFPELLDRIGASLTERRRAELERGSTIEGDGWALDRTGLRFGEEFTAEHLRFSDMAAVDLFDEQVMVWRVGEEEAAFRLPLDRRDSYLLLHLLPGLIPERPAEPEGAGVGRVLFERRLKRVKQGLQALGVVVAICGGLFCAGEVADHGWTLAGIVAGGVGGGGALMVALGFALPSARLRCHEQGVVLLSALGAERRLRYADVGSFTYRGTRSYYNGVYTGTTIEMTFVPRADVVAEPIKYSETLKHEDPALDLLRDHISKVIAGRMAQDLAAGRVVPWTDHLRFLPEQGIEHRPAGWIGRKDPVVHPFAQIGDFAVAEGWFHLWLQGSETSVVQEEVSQANFFPGFYLLSTLFAPPAEAEDGEADPPAPPA